MASLAASTRERGIDDEDREALIVFRNPEDASRYQETTDKHTAAEGFKLLRVTEETIASILEAHSLEWVAMPEEWTGTGDAGVAPSRVKNFVRMLEESRV